VTVDSESGQISGSFVRSGQSDGPGTAYKKGGHLTLSRLFISFFFRFLFIFSDSSLFNYITLLLCIAYLHSALPDPSSTYIAAVDISTADSLFTQPFLFHRSHPGIMLLYRIMHCNSKEPGQNYRCRKENQLSRHFSVNLSALFCR